MTDKQPEALRLAQPQQEPVAWRTFDGEGGYDYRAYDMNENYAEEWAKRNPRHKVWVEPLYTTPPRCPNCASLEAQNTELDAKLAGREWVGLTEEERSYYLQTASNIGWWKAAEILEAKLRHKNTVRMRRATREEKIDNPGVYWVEDKE